MNINNFFSPVRFLNLLKKDVFMIYKNVGITIGAITGVFIMYNVLTMNSYTSSNFSTMFNLLLFGGFIVTSMAFTEMHNKETVHNWLMLPVSSFEKFIVRLLMVSVGYILFALLTLFFISFTSALLYKFIFNMEYEISNFLFNPFTGSVWKDILNFFIIQSIFFCGAAYFKRIHFVKTTFFLGTLFLALFIVLGILFKIVFWDLGSFSLNITNISSFNFLPWAKYGKVADVLLGVARFFYYALLAPVCWVITYLRVQEIEVHHGI